jgi:hypothetical protein
MRRMRAGVVACAAQRLTYFRVGLMAQPDAHAIFDPFRLSRPHKRFCLAQPSLTDRCAGGIEKLDQGKGVDLDPRRVRLSARKTWGAAASGHAPRQNGEPTLLVLQYPPNHFAAIAFKTFLCINAL